MQCVGETPHPAFASAPRAVESARQLQLGALMRLVLGAAVLSVMATGALAAKPAARG